VRHEPSHADESVAPPTELNVSADVGAADLAFSIIVRPHVAVIHWDAPRPTIELVEQGFAALLHHKQFQPHIGVVSDWRRASAPAAPNFERSFFRALARLQSNGALGRWGAVVPASAQMVSLYGVGRTIEILGRAKGLQYEVFLDFKAALLWAARRDLPRQQRQPKRQRRRA
jgi:hypothetical protein